MWIRHLISPKAFAASGVDAYEVVHLYCMGHDHKLQRLNFDNKTIVHISRENAGVFNGTAGNVVERAIRQREGHERRVVVAAKRARNAKRRCGGAEPKVGVIRRKAEDNNRLKPHRLRNRERLRYEPCPDATSLVFWDDGHWRQREGFCSVCDSGRRLRWPCSRRGLLL